MTVIPTVRGRLSTTNTGTTAIPVNVPTDATAPVAGDLMVVTINTTANVSITAPALGSWVQVLAPTAFGSRYVSVWRGIRGASDGAQYAFSQSTTSAALAHVFYAPARWGMAGAFSKAATSSATHTTLGVTTTVPNSLAVSIQAEATAATELDSDITVAAPFVKQSWTITSTSPINSILIAHRDMAAAGPTGDAVSTWKNATGNRSSIMVVLEPLPDTAPAPVAKLAATMSDGAGNPIPVGLTAWDGTKEVPVAKLEYIHSGTFVTDLDRLDRVWWMAHRGGSADYQEHSKVGYQQSAICHADVLEMSLAMTSDGVYLGAHDETANRTTSGLPAGWKFSEHTWAEVKALVQDLPNRGDNRFTTAPYMRIEELVDQWLPSHTLMFDPKHVNTAGRRPLMAYLASLPDYRQRVLGKFYTTGTAIADEFHAIGCKVWGYSYTADVESGATAATAAKWDYLGLEYNASEATWARMLTIAGDKRVIGHICPNAAAAQMAVSRGARALQVSGVRSVSTVY